MVYRLAGNLAILLPHRFPLGVKVMCTTPGSGISLKPYFLSIFQPDLVNMARYLGAW